LETGGVRFVPVSCPASDHFWNPPASASAACCRSGQRSLPSLLPVAIHVDLWLARARPTRPRRCPEQTEPLAPRCACPPTSPISFSRIRLRGATVEATWGFNSSMSPDSKPALSAPPDPKMIRSRARTGTGVRPLFPKSHLPVFSLLFAFGEII
jgi:hypothetical protein